MKFIIWFFNFLSKTQGTLVAIKMIIDWLTEIISKLPKFEQDQADEHARKAFDRKELNNE
jgi:hypothetical protein